MIFKLPSERKGSKKASITKVLAGLYNKKPAKSFHLKERSKWKQSELRDTIIEVTQSTDMQSVNLEQFTSSRPTIRKDSESLLP